jgi:hypothetical protein
MFCGYLAVENTSQQVTGRTMMRKKAVGAKPSKTRKRKDVKVAQGVKDNPEPEITEQATAEVPIGVEGSADGIAELPREIAPSNEPSDSLPAIPSQLETFSRNNLPPELAPDWVAPIKWGLEERVARAEKLAYWADGIGRLDALVTKRHGESLWHCWVWFKQRRESLKAEGKRLKDENLTWTKLQAMKKWDRATVSRKMCVSKIIDVKSAGFEQLI